MLEKKVKPLNEGITPPPPNKSLNSLNKGGEKGITPPPPIVSPTTTPTNNPNTGNAPSPTPSNDKNRE